MKLLAGSIASMLALATPAPAEAAILEDLIEGRFVARGLMRISPDRPLERVFCRLSAKRSDASRFAIKGRCASAGRSGSLRIDLAVVRPARRYEMIISFRAARLFGYEDSYRYTGIATAHKVDFATTFSLGGKQYRSKVLFSFGKTGLQRLRETVIDRADGRKTMLFDLTVKRE